LNFLSFFILSWEVVNNHVNATTRRSGAGYRFTSWLFCRFEIEVYAASLAGDPGCRVNGRSSNRTFVSRQRYLSVKHRASGFEFSPGGLQYLADSVGLSIPDLAQPIASLDFHGSKTA
jgi:hypothetical protein